MLTPIRRCVLTLGVVALLMYTLLFEGYQASLEPFWEESTSILNQAIAELKLPYKSTLQVKLNSTLCDKIRSKKILLVGGIRTYHLHTRWLQNDSDEHYCPGPEFCSFHTVCRPSSYASNDSARAKTVPKQSELDKEGIALLRYVFSSTLFTNQDANHLRYTRPYIDPETGILTRDMPWMEAAAKSDIVILHRGPISAPMHSWNGTSNWSSFNKKTILKTLQDALQVTIDTFLPETIEVLYQTIGKTPRIVWHGAWYILPECALGNSRSSLKIKSTPHGFPVADLWSLYHNAQDQLLAEVLPRFGVDFIPLAMDTNYTLVGNPKRKDCLHYPNENPLEKKFFDSVARLYI